MFVNYGTPDDWDYILKNASINITGKIVLCKYGKAFRGDLVRTRSVHHIIGLNFTLNSDVQLVLKLAFFFR